MDKSVKSQNIGDICRYFIFFFSNDNRCLLSHMVLLIPGISGIYPRYIPTFSSMAEAKEIHFIRK